MFDSFQKAINEFIKKSSALQTTHIWGQVVASTPSPLDRIVAYALASGRLLLNSESALNAVVKTGGVQVQITRRLGNPETDQDFTIVLRNLHYERVRSPRSSRPSVWFEKNNVWAAYSMPQHDDEGYLVFLNVAKNLRRAEVIQSVTSFMQIFEAALASTMAIDFLQDQKRLLSRRTIVAQLRPNDLFYQALRRLHKYVAWERSALILGPRPSTQNLDSPTGRNRPRNSVIEWYIAAERLRGVSEVSQRVGMRFKMDAKLAQYQVEPCLVGNIGDLRRPDATAWERLIFNVLAPSEGLPQSLPEPRSALVVPIGQLPTADHSFATLPFVVLLSDFRTHRFTYEHSQLVKEFFSDVQPLLQKSDAFSERLIKLWTPLKTASAEDVSVSHHPDSSESIEHPDVAESIEQEAALPNEALEVLGVDALQVIQLRRGSITKEATGKIDFLTAISIAKGPEGGPIEFHRDARAGSFVTSKADILWRVFAERQDYGHKTFEGLNQCQMANLIPSPKTIYRTVLIVPIHSEGEFAGVLIAYRKKLSEFVDVDKLLVRSLAARLGERIELHRKLADRVRLVTCLSRVATAPDSFAARRALVQGAREMLNADHVFMMEIKDRSDNNESLAAPVIDEVAHTWEDGKMSVRRIKASIEGITGKVFVSGKSLAVPDVSKFKKYVPIRTATRRTVKVASELAVPIKAPFSDGAHDKSKVLGVLDALWKQPHTITRREVNTLDALAGHASALLQLTTGLQVAVQMRQSLQKLLHEAIALQETKSTDEVIRWLATTILSDDKTEGLIDCDMVVVWEHTRDSKYMNLLLVQGKRKDELQQKKQVPCKGSWTASVIRRFREGELKSAFDYYDRPTRRRHIPGTRLDRYQSIVARCMVPTSSPESSELGPRTVWAVCLYRFRKSNFNEHDGVLLQFAAEYCEAALQKLHSTQAQTRSLELARAAQDVALRMIAGMRSDQRKVIEYICERVHNELGASRVATLYYETGSSTAPTYFAFPKTMRDSNAPRKDGLSEAVRILARVAAIEDVDNPPPELSKAIQSSPFFKKHREIRAFIAVPLFEVEEQASNRFFGIMYVDFTEKRSPTTPELEFLTIVQRFLAECGGLEGKLLQMRAEALQNVQRIEDPSQVFNHILTIALRTLESEFSLNARKNPQFKLEGNLYMVSQGQNWAKLRVRHNVGELSGKQPGVQDIGEGVVGRVAKDGQPHIVDDTRSEASIQAGYLPYLKDMRSELAVPITLHNTPDINDRVASGVIGVINVECSLPNVFTARHQRLLMGFSASPVALILYLAERHGQRLWQVRKDEDEFLMDVALLVMHNLTRPMVTLGSQVANIKSALPHVSVKKIESTLNEMNQESQKWVEFRNTGIHFLRRKILNERRKLDVVEQIKAWAAERKVKVSGARVTEFFIQKGHPELIASILENFYSNSVKAHQETKRRTRPKIWITMEVTPEFSESGSCLDVFFHDNGPGIKEYNAANSSELFRPFEYRRRGKSIGVGSDGGWRLGLPVIRQMTHLMGGTVDIVDSRPNEKTSFRLRFMAQPISERRS